MTTTVWPGFTPALMKLATASVTRVPAIAVNVPTVKLAATVTKKEAPVSVTNATSTVTELAVTAEMRRKSDSPFTPDKVLTKSAT